MPCYLQFFLEAVNTEKRPLCPKCHRVKLDRYLSVFSTPRNTNQEEDTPFPDLDETKMEGAMSLLAREAEHVDENDPRQAAHDA